MSSVSAFFRDERGSETIEFVLWLPLTCALLVTVIDAATLYLTYAEMENVARDTARRMTTGRIANKQAAINHASGQFMLNKIPYIVDAIYDPTASMVVSVKVNVADATPFGYLLAAALGGDMVAQVAMRSDPLLAAFGAGGSGNGNGNGNGNGGGSTGGGGNGGGGTGGNGGGGTGGNGGGNGGGPKK